MPAVRTGPIIGLIVQVALLAALAAAVGLGAAGWLAGVACGVVTCAALTWGLNRSGAGALGPADRVTLIRATLAGAVAALTVDSFDRHAQVEVLIPLAIAALALDAVDGQVARRTGTVSALGARFDMEVDAFLVLVLSIYATRPMGAWVLALGAMRYVFVAASWVLPWLRGSLPPRFWRKVVAATQGIVVVSAAADVLPRPLMAAALVASLALVLESFGRDVGSLWRHRADQSERRHAPASGHGVSLNVTPDVVVPQADIFRKRSNGKQGRSGSRSGHPMLPDRHNGSAHGPLGAVDRQVDSAPVTRRSTPT